MKLGRWAAAAVVCSTLAAGCADAEDPELPVLFPDDSVPTDATDIGTDDTPTSTVPVAERLAAPAEDAPGAVRAADGTARSILGTDGEVWFIPGACGGEGVEPAATASLLGPAHVVLDPAGGGALRGESLSGVVEAEVMLDVAERVAAQLRALGVEVVVTRTTDVDLSSATRGSLASAVGASALVSLHLVEAGRAQTETPNPEVIHRADDGESRRLGGLLHEELGAALAAAGDAWSALPEPGVKPRLNQRGEDFHAVVRAAEPAAAVLIELMALGDNEAALLGEEEGRDIVAAAVADALVRFLVTEEAGSGFLEPEDLVRTAPTSNTPGGCG